MNQFSLQESRLADDQGLLERIAAGGLAEVHLDIGCGPSKVAGTIGIDALPYEGVDLVGDVFDVLAALPDQSVDHVHSKHFFEHVADLGRLIEELGRVLKVGATAQVIVPHFSNPYYYSDPTHRTPFGLYTFCYYARADGMFRRQVPTYQRELRFAITRIELHFQTTQGQYVRSALKKSLTRIVNLSAYTQELYEEMFCYLLPCHELRYTLRRI
jgi:SAM-dependent methyltransferase